MLSRWFTHDKEYVNSEEYSNKMKQSEILSFIDSALTEANEVKAMNSMKQQADDNVLMKGSILIDLVE